MGGIKIDFMRLEPIITAFEKNYKPFDIMPACYTIWNFNHWFTNVSVIEAAIYFMMCNI